MEKKMATTKSISANSVKNRGGVGVNLGSTSTVLNNSGLGLKSAATGSIVIDGTDTDTALSGGVFAYNNQKPVAKRVTTSLATVVKTTLVSGASVPSLNRSVHKIESVVTRRTSTAFRAGQFNIYTGSFSVAPTVATDTFHKSVVGTTYVDSVANVSRDNPGKAVYRSGSKVPTTNSYGN
jgi:hypothetical protein